jgi:hypothetical protein
VDVDRGACEESGAKGQFSEHMQGETHMPTVAEEPNLGVLESTAITLSTEPNTVLSMGHGGPGLHKNMGWLLL